MEKNRFLVTNPDLLKLVKQYTSIFRFFGFTTFENKDYYSLGSFTYLPLLGTYQKDTEKEVFRLINKKQKFEMVKSAKDSNCSCYFEEKRFNYIVKANLEVFPYQLHITKMDEEENVGLKITEEEICFWKEDSCKNQIFHFKKDKKASYIEQQEEKIHKIEFEIDDEKKGHFQILNEQKDEIVLEEEHIITFSSFNPYAKELFQTKEVQELYHSVTEQIRSVLFGIEKVLYNTSLFKTLLEKQANSKFIQWYYDKQKKLHEMQNPIRIQQVLNMMQEENEKILSKKEIDDRKYSLRILK